MILRVFGSPRLETDEGNHEHRITTHTKKFALLVFVSCSRWSVPIRRTELITMFWPESGTSKGRNTLRQTLHAIRRELGTDVIRCNGSEELWVDRSKISCDVTSFEEALTKGLPETAMGLYEGDFLVRFTLPDCPEFGDWVDIRRGTLREQAASASQDLARQAEANLDSDQALFWWRKALLFRPFDEVIIRRIGSLLAWANNRGEAVAEMRAFVQRLITDLGVEPSQATLRQLHAISSGPLTEISKWVGDRRDPWIGKSERHRRRLADHNLI